ncbi:hypothetical protein ACWF94_04200 [Streptomyces sp. NPDC055078]
MRHPWDREEPPSARDVARRNGGRIGEVEAGDGSYGALAWWLHARRNARDYEARPEHSEAMLTLAAISLMTRRLTRRSPYPTSAAPRPAGTVQAA